MVVAACGGFQCALHIGVGGLHVPIARGCGLREGGGLCGCGFHIIHCFTRCAISGTPTVLDNLAPTGQDAAEFAVFTTLGSSSTEELSRFNTLGKMRTSLGNFARQCQTLQVQLFLIKKDSERVISRNGVREFLIVEHTVYGWINKK